MKYIKDFFSGALIGFANTIPGVSGGTMAVILNIYDKILYAVSLKNLKKNLPFLIVLTLGLVVGIFLCAKVIMEAMKSHEMILNFCFIGLIVGSIPTIYRTANEGSDRLRTRNVALFFLALIGMIVVSLWGTFSGSEEAANKTLSDFGGVSIGLCLWLFACALISTIAMLLPGVSGSLLLLIFGVYTLTLESINSILDIIIGKAPLDTLSQSAAVLSVPIILGMLIGLFLGIKLIKLALRFHRQAMYFIILGLITGSVFPVITQTDFSVFGANLDGVLSVLGLIFFGFLAFFLGYKKRS